MPTELHADFTVRRLTRREVGLLRDLPNAEGWNPGLHDAGVFHDTDPDGFFVGELDGRPVAIVSGVAYDSFGFVGLYICRPEFRGRGFGLRVFQEAMGHLGDRNVGLDGVVAQQDNYRKSGFHYCYDNVRYQAVGGGEPVVDVVPLSEVPFDDLNAYDRAHFPAPRPEFLRGWIAIPGSAALARLRGGRLVGYGVIRPCVVGFKIGPLFADDPGVADELLLSLLAHAPGQTVLFDVPDDSANPHAAEVVTRYASPHGYRTGRMYTKGAPPLPLDQVYGVTSLELG